MSNLILNIDTAASNASVCLAEDGKSIAMVSNVEQKDHASWIHLAIMELLDKAGFTLKQVDAFAVSAGPGSYTGLRVSMATAKGYCYVLDTPLILEKTLKIMAWSAIQQLPEGHDNMFLCPMIDARRMEVFTALYKENLEEKMPPAPIILDFNSFESILADHTVLFFGSGSHKFSALQTGKNARFEDIVTHAGHLAALSAQKFTQSDFADLASAAPYYGKSFHTTAPEK